LLKGKERITAAVHRRNPAPEIVNASHESHASMASTRFVRYPLSVREGTPPRVTLEAAKYAAMEYTKASKAKAMGISTLRAHSIGQLAVAYKAYRR
jgi:hypothetical protein